MAQLFCAPYNTRIVDAQFHASTILTLRKQPYVKALFRLSSAWQKRPATLSFNKTCYFLIFLYSTRPAAPIPSSTKVPGSGTGGGPGAAKAEPATDTIRVQTDRIVEINFFMTNPFQLLINETFSCLAITMPLHNYIILHVLLLFYCRGKLERKEIRHTLKLFKSTHYTPFRQGSTKSHCRRVHELNHLFLQLSIWVYISMRCNLNNLSDNFTAHLLADSVHPTDSTS